MITYADLLKKKREEEENKRTLLPLSDQDLQDISELFEVLRKRIDEAANEEEKSDAKLQFENAKRAFLGLIKERVFKLLHYSMLEIQPIPFDKMNSVEKEFFNNLNQNVNLLLQEMNKITENVKKKEKETEKEEKNDNKIKVEILEDLNEFKGFNASYGPYKKGEIVELPKNVGEILVKANKAKYI